MKVSWTYNSTGYKDIIIDTVEIVLQWLLHTVFRPPVIRGNTTVDEGDTLSLECDSSNSAPLPTVYWLSPDGEMISNSRDLMISNITRDMAGTYICVAISGNTGATMNATVNVIVYNIPPTEMETVCKCHRHCITSLYCVHLPLI